VLEEIIGIEDPSKIVYTLCKGIILMIDITKNGVGASFENWEDIKLEISKYLANG